MIFDNKINYYVVGDEQFPVRIPEIAGVSQYHIIPALLSFKIVDVNISSREDIYTVDVPYNKKHIRSLVALSNSFIYGTPEEFHEDDANKNKKYSKFLNEVYLRRQQKTHTGLIRGYEKVWYKVYLSKFTAKSGYKGFFAGRGLGIKTVFKAFGRSPINRKIITDLLLLHYQPVTAAITEMSYSFKTYVKPITCKVLEKIVENNKKIMDYERNISREELEKKLKIASVFGGDK